MWATTCKGCTDQDVFFFPCLPSPPLRCLSVFGLISPFLFLSLNFDIRTFPRMSVTNCSPTLWQCFCSPKPLYELPVFVSFFLFFPSRSGAPDVKPPRYGVYWFAFPSQPPDHNIPPSPEIIWVKCAALIFPLLFSHILASSFFASCHVMLTTHSIFVRQTLVLTTDWATGTSPLTSAVFRQGNSSTLKAFLGLVSWCFQRT